MRRWNNPNCGYQKGHIGWNKGNIHKVNVICQFCGKSRKVFLCKQARKFCNMKCYGESKKGKSSYWSGKKRPEIKEWLNPYKKDDIRITGKNNNFWKGGITPIHEKLRKSFEYEEWRKSIFERDLYTCQHCGEVGGYLHADYIKPFSLFPELRLDINNGQTLCVPCHKKTYSYLNPFMKREDFK